MESYNLKKGAFITMITIAAMATISCGGSTSGEMSETDSLRLENKELHQQVDDYTMMLSVITSSMDSLESSQSSLLSSGDREGTPKGPSKAQIEKKLRTFEDLVARQRERIAKLEASLSGNKKHSAAQIANLRGVINMMQEQLNQKDALIADLREQLNNKDIDIANLRTHITGLNTNIEALTTETVEMKKELENAGSTARECYILIASKKELKKAGLLQGDGFMSKKKLNANNINVNMFQKHDRKQLTEIVVNSKRPNVLTAMPSSSYSIRNNGDGTSTIVINDVNKFWSVSKYLIVQTR